jgi:HSP20 family protein
MAKSKNPPKKSTGIAPFLTSSWMDIDRSIENLRKDMEKAFSSFPSISMPKMPEASCDVIDEGNQFRVKMNVPGVQKKDINLNVTDNSLEISAEHKEESEEKKKNYLRKERSDVSYYRTLPLPENVVSGKVKAKMTDGVLEVILPKTKPTPKPKKRSVTVQ